MELNKLLIALVALVMSALAVAQSLTISSDGQTGCLPLS
jgi:hypothetical protein